MTLLDGPDSVTVTPKVKGEGDYGTRLVDGAPVRVDRVAVQPARGAAMSENETAYAAGDQVRVDLIVFGRGRWPGGPHSTVRVETGPYAGLLFDQNGLPEMHARSRATAHYQVALTLRSTEVR